MQFQFDEFEPPADLHPYLRRSFYARGQIPYRSDKILPNGLVVVIFTLENAHRLGSSDIADDNPLFEHSWFHGVQTSPVYNLPTGETHVLGLLFEPIGFHALFGTDLRPLTDRTVDGRSVLPPEFVRLVERSLPGAGDEASHAAIHQALLDRSGENLPTWLWHFFETLKSTQGAASLSGAYENTGRSARYVGERFKRSTGVSPKVLARIYRLNALLSAVDPGSSIPWTDLSHQFGFFDQAHFNREFKRFSGLSPSQYNAKRLRQFPELKQGENVNFVPRDQ